jgi:hypothetical protein
MPALNTSDLLRIYLDGNSNETPEVLNAERHLLQIGYPIVPSLVEALRDRLRKYRSYTLSYSEEQDFMKRAKDLFGEIPGSLYEDRLAEEARELEKHRDKPGISIGQRAVSSGSIRRASKLVKIMGDVCDKPLCQFLKKTDMSLVLTSATILNDLEDPSPFVVKSIISTSYFHLKSDVWPMQHWVLFYVLLETIAHSGDEFAIKFFKEDSAFHGTDPDTFSNYLRDMCVYFVSIS